LGHKDHKDWTTRFAITQEGGYQTGKPDKPRGWQGHKTQHWGNNDTRHEADGLSAPWLVCHVQEETDEESIVRTTGEEKHRKLEGRLMRAVTYRSPNTKHEYHIKPENDVFACHRGWWTVERRISTCMGAYQIVGNILYLHSKMDDEMIAQET